MSDKDKPKEGWLDRLGKKAEAKSEEMNRNTRARLRQVDNIVSGGKPNRATNAVRRLMDSGKKKSGDDDKKR